MPLLRFVSAVLCLLSVVTACARSPQSAAGPEPSQSVLFAPAGAVGDTVWVILTPVRADRREEFERLMETLWRQGTSFGAQEDSVVLRTFRRTRLLRPVSLGDLISGRTRGHSHPATSSRSGSEPVRPHCQINPLHPPAAFPSVSAATAGSCTIT